jgi:GST-like protein
MTALNTHYTLYTSPTPNGHKASVTLEELELSYECHAIDLTSNAQKEEWFLKLNPNGRIPVLVDRDPDGSGERDKTSDTSDPVDTLDPFAVFETGAIMVYLAEKTGRLLPTDLRGRSRTMQWLMFQMGGIGPMMGQANVFYRYFPEKIQPAIDRYQNETRRLFEVLERGLTESEWLAGNEFTIADIANWCWVRTYRWSGVSIDGLPNIRRWLDAIRERPGCQRGIEVPFKVKSLLKDDDGAKKFAENAGKILQQ